MITAQVESLTAGLEEIKPLLPIHYEELSLHKFHGFPLAPIYEDYLARDAAGQVLYITIREQGELLGYFVGFIGPALHYQGCLSLMLDIFYILPKARGNNGGVIMFNAVITECKRRGVKAFNMGCKEHMKEFAERLFRAIGAEPSESHYCLWLGG